MADARRQSLLLVVAALLAWRSQATLAPLIWFGETPAGRVIVLEDGRTTAWSPPLQESSARLALGLPVLINRASAEELEQVPGIGPRTATKIVQSRFSGGCFDRHSGLMRARDRAEDGVKACTLSWLWGHETSGVRCHQTWLGYPTAASGW